MRNSEILFLPESTFNSINMIELPGAFISAASSIEFSAYREIQGYRESTRQPLNRRENRNWWNTRHKRARIHGTILERRSSSSSSSLSSENSFSTSPWKWGRTKRKTRLCFPLFLTFERTASRRCIVALFFYSPVSEKNRKRWEINGETIKNKKRRERSIIN